MSERILVTGAAGDVGSAVCDHLLERGFKVRAMTYVDVPWEPWRQALEDSGTLTPHVLAHLATMALLIQQDRYDRLTSDVERISGTPPLGVSDFVRRHADAYRPTA